MASKHDVAFTRLAQLDCRYQFWDQWSDTFHAIQMANAIFQTNM
jgi:hypothetical protein